MCRYVGSLCRALNMIRGAILNLILWRFSCVRKWAILRFSFSCFLLIIVSFWLRSGAVWRAAIELFCTEPRMAELAIKTSGIQSEVFSVVTPPTASLLWNLKLITLGSERVKRLKMHLKFCNCHVFIVVAYFRMGTFAKKIKSPLRKKHLLDWVV